MRETNTVLISLDDYDYLRSELHEFRLLKNKYHDLYLESIKLEADKEDLIFRLLSIDNKFEYSDEYHYWIKDDLIKLCCEYKVDYEPIDERIKKYFDDKQNDKQNENKENK